MYTWSKIASHMKKPVLAVDIDEVLGQFVFAICAWHNQHYNTSHSPEHFESYNFRNVFGGEGDKVFEFFESEYFKAGIPLVDGAKYSIERLNNIFELHIVTSRQLEIEEITRTWINTHFPNLFYEIHFGNHLPRDNNRQLSKPEMCKAIGAIAIIDDSVLYTNQCATEGIHSFLFGDYTWNSSRNGHEKHPDVCHVMNWDEAVFHLENLVFQLNMLQEN